jgi:hypothetical protein
MRRSIPTKSLGSWDSRQLLHVQHEEVRLPDDRLLHGADADDIHTSRNVVKRKVIKMGRDAETPLPQKNYLLLTAMCFTFCCACGDFGRVTVSTPFLNDAAILPSSTSSTGMRRSKRP